MCGDLGGAGARGPWRLGVLLLACPLLCPAIWMDGHERGGRRLAEHRVAQALHGNHSAVTVPAIQPAEAFDADYPTDGNRSHASGGGGGGGGGASNSSVGTPCSTGEPAPAPAPPVGTRPPLTGTGHDYVRDAQPVPTQTTTTQAPATSATEAAATAAAEATTTSTAGAGIGAAGGGYIHDGGRFVERLVQDVGLASRGFSRHVDDQRGALAQLEETVEVYRLAYKRLELALGLDREAQEELVAARVLRDRLHNESAAAQQAAEEAELARGLGEQEAEAARERAVNLRKAGGLTPEYLKAREDAAAAEEYTDAIRDNATSWGRTAGGLQRASERAAREQERARNTARASSTAVERERRAAGLADAALVRAAAGLRATQSRVDIAERELLGTTSTALLQARGPRPGHTLESVAVVLASAGLLLLAILVFLWTKQAS